MAASNNQVRHTVESDLADSTSQCTKVANLLESGKDSANQAGESGSKVVSKPTNVIKVHETVVSVANSTHSLTLITMKRSFLLVIGNPGKDFTQRSRKRTVTEDFMNSTDSLEGLSLAIGGLSTCLIPSKNSVASLSLASRLSKSLNLDGPVYVANNMQVDDSVDEDYVTNLYEAVFKFARRNYKPSAAQ